MKRILHIPKYYPPHTGGIEEVCYTIVSYLRTLSDIEQQVFCFGDEKRTRIDNHEGTRVVRMGSLGKVASQAIALRYLDFLRSEIRQFRPDIVHFHAPNPFGALCLLAVLPRSTKLIVHWHSDIIDQRQIYRFIKPLEKILLRRANVIVATSQCYIDGSQVLQSFKCKCVVIPNVVNTSKLAKNAALINEIHCRYHNKPILLFVGRHVPYKGLDYLLSAADMIGCDCQIVIGGDGPLTERLKKEYPSDNVHFVGRISDMELPAYYHAADLFLFPSITKNEAFGVALAEAMWCETPAVTFNIQGSGVNWVNIDGDTGIEVANCDTQQLAHAIDILLTDEDLRRKYGCNAHQRVEDHMTLDRITHLLDTLYS
jgi:glycosyltransferase involved in cell wall biosynthesis